jgi:hypothetical protein
MIYAGYCGVRWHKFLLILPVDDSRQRFFFSSWNLNNAEFGLRVSFVDDLVSPGYCKHERYLCISRYWGLSLVSMICSSLFSNYGLSDQSSERFPFDRV